MKKLVAIKIFLFMFMILMVGCQSGAQQSEVTLYAKSLDWDIFVVYKPTKDGYIETPTIEYLGESKIRRVELHINYKNNSATSNGIQMENLAEIGPLELATRTEVKNWKDATDVRVEWEEGNQTFEETIKLRSERIK